MNKDLSRLNKIRRARQTIIRTKRWIPSLVKAMRLLGYKRTFVDEIEKITSNSSLYKDKEVVKTEEEKFKVKKEAKRTLRIGRIYKFVNNRMSLRPMMLGMMSEHTIVARLTAFNESGIVVKVMAHSCGIPSPFHQFPSRTRGIPSPFHQFPSRTRNEYSLKIGYVNRPTMSNYWIAMNKMIITEVPEKDLILYLNMNPTRLLTDLIKGGN